jgi:hypothetical protein
MTMNKQIEIIFLFIWFYPCIGITINIPGGYFPKFVAILLHSRQNEKKKRNEIRYNKFGRRAFAVYYRDMPGG